MKRRIGRQYYEYLSYLNMRYVINTNFFIYIPLLYFCCHHSVGYILIIGIILLYLEKKRMKYIDKLEHQLRRKELVMNYIIKKFEGAKNE